MKRVLVLYPGLVESRCALLAPHRLRLRLARIGLVLADERLGPADADVFLDTLELPPPERAAEAWDVLARYLAANPVDAIVAQSEPALLLGARAGREFSLRGPSVGAALATVNKWQSRMLLTEARIPQPRFALARTTNDVRRFVAATGLGWPVVLKAVASSRQRLVTCVRSDDEVDVAVTRLRRLIPTSKDVRRLTAFARLERVNLDCDPLREFLVESLAPGEPVECDGVVSRDVVRSLGVCAQVPADGPDFFIDGYLLPAPLPAARRIDLERTTAAALRALKLSDSGYSVEYRVTRDAQRLIEVNGRLGWDEGLGDMFTAACGHYPAVIALKLALGKRIGDLRPRRAAAIHYGSWFEEGTVERIPTKAELRHLVGRNLDCQVNATKGALVLAARHPESRPHLAHAIASDERSSLAAYARARDAVRGLNIVVRAKGGPARKARSRRVHIAPADAAR